MRPQEERARPQEDPLFKRQAIVKDRDIEELGQKAASRATNDDSSECPCMASRQANASDMPSFIKLYMGHCVDSRCGQFIFWWASHFPMSQLVHSSGSPEA